MSRKNWQRARKSEQIEQRTGDLLAAAEKLFRTEAYDKITLQKIAKAADFTLSNIYRYFKTKEEIFLKIYIADLTDIADGACSVFNNEMSIGLFTERLTNLIEGNKRFLELSPILAVSLERNSSEEVYRNAKLQIAEQAERIAKAVAVARPKMKPEETMDFIKLCLALVAGVWPMSQVSETQLKIIEETGLTRFRINFNSFLKDTIKIYLAGLRVN